MELTKLGLPTPPLDRACCFCDWRPLLQAMSDSALCQFIGHFCQLVDSMEQVAQLTEDGFYGI